MSADMARRSRGDGSVYYDAARGCWVGSVDVGRDPETGRRRRRKVSAPNKTECKDKLDELREEYRKAGTVGRRDVTVRQVVDDWLANPPESVRSPNSVDVYRDAGDRVIGGGRGVPGIGNTTLARLTAGDVERLLAGLARAGYSRKTISQTRSVLRRSLRRAQRDGLTSRNAAELAELPAGGRTRRSKAMTSSQVAALLALELTPWWRAYIVTAIMLGLRPGEMTGLRWADVDIRNGVIRVRQAVKRIAGNGLVLAELKTEQSKRTLQAPAMVTAVLERQRKVQAAERLRALEWEDNDLVFAAPDGQPVPPRTVNLGLKRLCERAGLGRDWQPRETRHTFVSALSDAGVDIEKIADAAGHINSTVTKVVYRHGLADVVAEAAGVMDRLYPPESTS
jgi:integrase